MAKDLALYIHVPFCVQRCNYCDFCSSTELELIESYFAKLNKDISLYSKTVQRPVSSIYFGGGTPSLAAQHLIASLDTVRENFTLSADCEITLEANPESFSAKNARALAAAGFTRVSIGVQSFNEEMLILLGRAHSADSAWSALRAAQDAGLRTSFDLMLGLTTPLEKLMSKEQWDRLLSTVDHVSAYPLTVEEGTALEKMENVGAFNQVSEGEMAAEVIYLEKLLADYGLKRYEISSYARLGQESRQNQTYWFGGDYLGFGVSAASMCNQSDGKRKRFVVYDRMEDFLGDTEGQQWKQSDFAEQDILTADEAQREDVMLALRTSRGISAGAVAAAGLTLVCDELIEKGLLELHQPIHQSIHQPKRTAEEVHYRCTQQGWLLANMVFAAVWFPSG